MGLAFKFGFVGGDAASLTLPFGEGGTAERWVRIELKTNCVSTVFTSSTTFGGPPSPKGKVGERGNEPTAKPQFTIPQEWVGQR